MIGMLRSLGSGVFASVILLLAPAGAGAGQVRTLTNLHGNVLYQRPGAALQPLARSASVAVTRSDIAATRRASMGALTLPDSSRILLGENTRVRIGGFSESSVTSAHFVIYNGKTRFFVEHPAGAKANYTFETPVAQIAVRGTVGDISVDINDGMRLNVYHVGDPGLPVIVRTIYGQRFTLHGGQKVWVRWLNGRLVGRETALSRAEIARFAQFGAPPRIDGGLPP
ncbi:MAG TPA: FecR domain-containing protein [Candidatus Dormibacteraeota bacterium]|nr:FecR domain-containing protein [Candidatus Dormibacteraeota bacterium]